MLQNRLHYLGVRLVAGCLVQCPLLAVVEFVHVGRRVVCQQYLNNLVMPVFACEEQRGRLVVLVHRFNLGAELQEKLCHRGVPFLASHVQQRLQAVFVILDLGVGAEHEQGSHERNALLRRICLAFAAFACGERVERELEGREQLGDGGGLEVDGAVHAPLVVVVTVEPAGVLVVLVLVQIFQELLLESSLLLDKRLCHRCVLEKLVLAQRLLQRLQISEHLLAEVVSHRDVLLLPPRKELLHRAPLEVAVDARRHHDHVPLARDLHVRLPRGLDVRQRRERDLVLVRVLREEGERGPPIDTAELDLEDDRHVLAFWDVCDGHFFVGRCRHEPVFNTAARP
mmetsp:Transcript_59874/g.141000  ORF Transcript_59874/g.141000 Transcript_59874/m.141000 type:complete len:341 (-) Transcript_59874:2043-3065(-)